MQLRIRYNIESEQQRIQKTLEKLSWYEQMGYRPRFPEGIDPHNDTLDKIFKAVQNEFDINQYQQAATRLTNDINSVQRDFFSTLQTMLQKELPEVIEIQLTKYGVGGSYSLPNTVILNINMKSSINTVLHEMTHLIVEPYIQEYKLEQNEKERLVDLILTSGDISLAKYEIQERGLMYKNIMDPLFKECFHKSPEQFFRAYAKRRTLNTNAAQHGLTGSTSLHGA